MLKYATTLLQQSALDKIAQNMNSEPIGARLPDSESGELVLKLRYGHQEVFPLLQHAHRQGFEQLFDSNVVHFAKGVQTGRSTMYREFKRFEVVRSDEPSTRSRLPVLPEVYSPVSMALGFYYDHPEIESVLKEAYEKVIATTGNNLTSFSELMGVGRATVYRHFKKYKIPLDAHRKVSRRDSTL